MSRVYLLGGRTFAPTETLTGRQDGWMIVVAQDIGLLAIIGKRFDGASTDVGAATDFLVEAHRAGKFYHVIAGRLVEDGKRWNPKDAEANAEFFAELSDPSEKSQLATAFVEVLTSFFTTVAASLTASRSSSTPATTASTDLTPAAARNGAGSSTSKPAATDGPSVRAPSPTATATG